MSVGLTDKDESEYTSRGYDVLRSCIGRVYIPTEKVEITGPIAVRWEEHPWISKFEMDGIKPAPPIRKGFGSRTVRQFVESLFSIYANAYADYSAAAAAEDFFRKVTLYFIERMHREGATDKLSRMFAGFTENMWREGDEESCDIAMKIIVPQLLADETAKEVLGNTMSPDFREYVAGFY